MITTLKTWSETTKALLKKPRALAIFAALYSVLLATLYIFVTTREATAWQVIITFLFLVLIPAEFFILQAAIVAHAHDGEFQWGRILRHALKIAVTTIPIILVGYLFWILLNKWQAHYPPPVPSLTLPTPPAAAGPQPIHWPTLLFATLRCLLFGIVLPLALIHLWIEVTANDLRNLFSGGSNASLKRIGNVFARAFASDSVLIYALGLLLFVVIPYAALFVRLPARGTKTDFAVFIARLVLAFAFTLIGWVVTLSALARTGNNVDAVANRDVVPVEAPA